MTKKYYDDEKMTSIRRKFDEKILQWDDVHIKKMFGCPCYRVGDRLFAFLVTNGVVVTQLDQADREELTRRFHATPFHAGKRIVQNWPRITIEKTEDITLILPFVRESYESASQKTQ